jgi:hypothetical protein
MIRRCAVLLLALTFSGLPLLSEGRQETAGKMPGFLIDFSPLGAAKGTLDCKIWIISTTTMGDQFRRGITVKGAISNTSAEDALFIVKSLFVSQRWGVKEISKTQLYIVGKENNPVQSVEIDVKGLAVEYYPIVKRSEKKK